ncbi:MAG: hypothetical protein JWL73_2666 [Actinomycetia bacterium]|nr:hypothetical protein [Actinomycetes bacterium]
MDNGERVTGTPNESHDVVSVLHHALHGDQFRLPSRAEFIADVRS